jgi:protein-L-isoaspartate(D-aspartate) O-methyltransferase
MTDLQAQRRFFAEEIQMTSNLNSASIVEALAAVPREQFLPPGPWTIRGEADFQGSPRRTPDDDARHVYHNVAVAIDPSRMLFNGAPGILAMAIDALALAPGERVLHVGTGLGYYTAIAAHCVGAAGRVVGVEVDADLAAGARRNLGGYPWVEVRHGNGAEPLGEAFDAILINAGVTHPLASWLDALTPGGRIVVPVTATMPPMTTIGKGPMLLFTRQESTAPLAARFVGFVAIYTALGIRDESINGLLAQAMAKSPFAPVKSLRRDLHERDGSCWMHAPGCCLSLSAPSSC